MWLRRIRASMIEPSTYNLRKPAPASWPPTAGYILNSSCCQAFYFFTLRYHNAIQTINEKCPCTHMIWERRMLRLNKNTFSPKTHPGNLHEKWGESWRWEGHTLWDHGGHCASGRYLPYRPTEGLAKGLARGWMSAWMNANEIKKS